MHKTINATDNTIKEIVENQIDLLGINADLNHINVSEVTNMQSLFSHSVFVGDISKWDVSGVEDMQTMFSHSDFNGDISKWDVSGVEDMKAMFYKSDFNQDVSQWNTFSATEVRNMFLESPFNKDISQWALPPKLFIRASDSIASRNQTIDTQIRSENKGKMPGTALCNVVDASMSQEVLQKLLDTEDMKDYVMALASKYTDELESNAVVLENNQPVKE